MDREEGCLRGSVHNLQRNAFVFPVDSCLFTRGGRFAGRFITRRTIVMVCLSVRARVYVGSLRSYSKFPELKKPSQAASTRKWKHGWLRK